MERRVSGLGTTQWVGFIALYCSSTYGVEILLTRSFTPFLVTVYVPSGLLVIISSVPDD